MAGHFVLLRPHALLRRTGQLALWEAPVTGTEHSRIMLPSLVVFTRGKKAAKKQKRTKKDIQREQHREYLKKLETQRAYQGAIIKVVRRGEPLDPELLNPVRKRERPQLSQSEQDDRYLLVKEWSRFRMEENKFEHMQLKKMVECREKALRELKKTSFPLYQQAVKLRSDLFPLDLMGPPHTPPIPGYEPPEPADV